MSVQTATNKDVEATAATTEQKEKQIVSSAIERLTGRKPEKPAEQSTAAATTSENKEATAAKTEATAVAETKKPDPKAVETKAEPKGETAIERARKVAPQAKKQEQPAQQLSAGDVAAEVLRLQQEQQAKAAAANAPKKPTLAPDDQQELELAEYASGKKKDKYGDLPTKLTEYFQRRDEFLSEKAKEFGGRNSPDFAEFLHGEEYKTFVSDNRPGLTRADRADLERQRIRDEADSRADERVRETERKLRREIDAIKLAPVIEKKVNEALGELLSAEDEAVKAYQADPTKALNEMKLEASEVEQTAAGLRLVTEEYLNIHHGLKDPVQGNAIHDFLDKFVSEQGRQLDAKPEADRVRNGKILVSPIKYYELEKAGKASGYETFSDSDVVTMLANFTKNTLPARLNTIRKDLESSGYRRVVATDAAKKPVETASPSPKAVSSRSPGPSDAKTESVPRHLSLLTGRK